MPAFLQVVGEGADGEGYADPAGEGIVGFEIAPGVDHEQQAQGGEAKCDAEGGYDSCESECSGEGLGVVVEPERGSGDKEEAGYEYEAGGCVGKEVPEGLAVEVVGDVLCGCGGHGECFSFAYLWGVLRPTS